MISQLAAVVSKSTFAIRSFSIPSFAPHCSRTAPQDLMAHIPHALSLPEVAFPVAQYLELDDLAACSLVYKSFYASFAPYLWANVQLEVPSASEENSTPPRFTSKIDLSQYTRPSSPKNSTMDTLAIPIRRLYFHYAARCTNLHSILISAHSCAIQYEEAYWNTCEALVRQNSNCLRSLTLLDWRLRISNPLYPFWNLLHTCAQHANLSKLRTRYGKFHAQELEAFWTICRQLEILELTDMDMSILLGLSDDWSATVSERVHHGNQP
ncbi:hypothetical protein B0O80DRAFT_431552 [Mortierella sp. GBAus27b]|nr:hypothetical protein B0O80DRAFT_431552 [Mortierella sp. GBAus27b]